MVEAITIEKFFKLNDQLLVIDVRSPSEYNHAHIPGSVSVPLFTDEERAIVGTIYKQKSRERAIKQGLDYFGTKMRILVEQTEVLLKEGGQEGVIVHCWRGGMRSGAVSWLLDMYGMKVYTLIGGYKAFRNVILSEFQTPRKLNIIGGYTGSGKTKLLSELRSRGHHVIDLEKLANHKGSAFGHIGLGEQPSQEFFENQLAMELIKIPINEVIFLEDESIRLGHVNIPSPFFNHMSKAVVNFLDVSFEERLANILEEYGSLDKLELIQAIRRIEKRLGNQNMNKAIKSIENGDIKTSFEILLKYYDRFYQKCFDKKEKVLVHYERVKAFQDSFANGKFLESNNHYHP